MNHRTDSDSEASLLRDKEMLMLKGAIIGLHRTHTREQIEAVAHQATALLPAYDARWQHQNATLPVHWQGWHHLQAAQEQGRGVILAPTHFGPYRWIIPDLLRRGAKLTLLADQPFAAHLNYDVDTRVAALYPQLARTDFETIRSNDPSALWQLTRSLRRGRIVVLFIDGNAGLAGKADANGALTLTFLEQQIHVRPGTAALALASNACVLPISSELSAEEHACFRIEPDLSVDLPKNKSEAYLQLMRALYHALQTQVLAHPQRWEEWWLLPHWLAKAPSTEFSRTPRPNYVVTMPGLVRARLALPDTGCWLLHERTRDNNGHEHEVPLCFDLANTQIDTCSPVFADLFQAARKQEQARTWLCRQQDQAQARALLQNELRSGRIVLRRDTPEQPPT